MEERKLKGKIVKMLGLDYKRPTRITEEEISVAKEKNICLVCKSELSRSSYICPDCKTFYCLSCSEALSNIENACWTCNSLRNCNKKDWPGNWYGISRGCARRPTIRSTSGSRLGCLRPTRRFSKSCQRTENTCVPRR